MKENSSKKNIKTEIEQTNKEFEGFMEDLQPNEKKEDEPSVFITRLTYILMAIAGLILVSVFVLLVDKVIAFVKDLF